MPWKEPGEKPREPRPPWGNDNRPGGDDGGSVFDLEAQLKRARRRLGRFGGGPSGLFALIVLVVVLWFAFGAWTVVDAGQTGVVLRLGRYERTLGPGLHARLPRPFEQVLKVDVGRTRTVSDQLRMLTRDDQIALVDFYVQYRVADARRFLFAVRDPEDAMRQATLAAVRAQIGTQSMQALAAKLDPKLVARIRGDLQLKLDAYDSGIEVTDAGIQNVSVPQEVKPAWDDIGNARQDARRAEDETRAAAAGAETAARTQAAQLRADATAYKSRDIAAAQAATARFNLVLAQYRAAPDVTRRQLWLRTMQDVLGKSRTVIDAGSGQAVIQLPPQSAASSAAEHAQPPAPGASGNPAAKQGGGP